MRPRNNFQPVIITDSEFGRYGTPLFFQWKYMWCSIATTFRAPITTKAISNSAKGDESNDKSIVMWYNRRTRCFVERGVERYKYVRVARILSWMKWRWEGETISMTKVASAIAQDILVDSKKIYFTFIKVDNVFDTKIVINDYIITTKFIMRFLYLRIVNLTSD